MEDHLYLIYSATFFTCLVSGTFGMAGGLMLKVILVNLFSPNLAISTHALIQFKSNGIRSLLGWKAILWKNVITFMLGLLTIAYLIKLLHFQPSRQFILLLSGGVPLLVVFLGLQKKVWFPQFETRWGSYAAGIILGLIHLLGGVAGPLLDAFFHSKFWKKELTVTNKTITQSLAHSARLFFYGESLIEIRTPSIFIVLFLLILAGNWVGQTILKSMPEGHFRIWTQRLVVGLSLIALIQGLLLEFNSKF